MTSLETSTLFHLVAVLYAHENQYRAVIFTSTIASWLWHYIESYYGPSKTICTIDHVIAGIWFLYDVYYSIMLGNFWKVFGINMIITFMNRGVVWLDNKNIVSYRIGHTIWHYLSAAKAIYIAYEFRSTMDSLHDKTYTFQL